MSPQAEDFADEVELWNREDSFDLERPDDLSQYDIAVAARDWTVETVVSQVQQGNIDLDPAFQRRNAWRDSRRSRLLESFILGFPVPQIVLAENPHRRRSYIVIDGKQRLMTVAGFFLPEFRDYWTKPRFTGLKTLDKLNHVTIEEFQSSASYAQERRRLLNADIRTTVIAGFEDESVLYDIFYRINTGSVPLSSQELRQALHRGPFSQFLLERTSNPNPIWDVLRVDQPDPRLRDVELLLRLISWRLFAPSYQGNMKPFLDTTMDNLNKNWRSRQDEVDDLASQIFEGARTLVDALGRYAGRKRKDGRYQTQLNRAVFEVQTYYLSLGSVRRAVDKNPAAFRDAFKELFKQADFVASVESTTKSIENYRVRFSSFSKMLRDTYKVRTKKFEIGRNA